MPRKTRKGGGRGRWQGGSTSDTERTYQGYLVSRGEDPGKGASAPDTAASSLSRRMVKGNLEARIQRIGYEPTNYYLGRMVMARAKLTGIVNQVSREAGVECQQLESAPTSVMLLSGREINQLSGNLPYADIKRDASFRAVRNTLLSESQTWRQELPYPVAYVPGEDGLISLGVEYGDAGAQLTQTLCDERTLAITAMRRRCSDFVPDVNPLDTGDPYTIPLMVVLGDSEVVAASANHMLQQSGLAAQLGGGGFIRNLAI